MDVGHQCFDPPDGMYMRFDPRAAKDRQWSTTRRHRLNTGLFSVVIPRGFACDLGSIPWYLRWAFSPSGKAARAFVYHDAAYRCHIGTRFQADALLREVCVLDGVHKITTWLLWAGVRIGGRKIWKSYSESYVAQRVAMGAASPTQSYLDAKNMA